MGARTLSKKTGPTVSEDLTTYSAQEGNEAASLHLLDLVLEGLCRVVPIAARLMPPGAAFCPVFGGAFTVRFVTFSVVMGDGTDLNVTAAIGLQAHAPLQRVPGAATTSRRGGSAVLTGHGIVSPGSWRGRKEPYWGAWLTCESSRVRMYESSTIPPACRSLHGRAGRRTGPLCGGRSRRRTTASCSEDKMKRLVAELQSQQAEGARLDADIADKLKALGFGDREPSR